MSTVHGFQLNLLIHCVLLPHTHFLLLSEKVQARVTKPSISNFVLYPVIISFSCYIFVLSGVLVSKTIHDALLDLGWRHDMELKMATLH